MFDLRKLPNHQSVSICGFLGILAEVRSPVACDSIYYISACCVTAYLFKGAMFKFHDAFFMRMSSMTDRSYHQPVETKTYHFQTFYVLKSISVLLFSFIFI